MKITKLILSIASVCFSIAIMLFGVMAATQVTYSVTGRVSYTVTEAYIEITTKVFKYGDYSTTIVDMPVESPSTPTLAGLAEIFNNNSFDTLPTALSGDQRFSAYDDVTRYFNTYTNTNDQGEDITDEDSGIRQMSDENDTKSLLSDIPVNLNTTTHKAVFIVVEIHNVSDATLSLSVSNNITYANDVNKTASQVNVLEYKNTPSATIAPHNSANNADTVRVVVGFAIKDVTQSIDSVKFAYSISVANTPSS